MMRMKRKKKMMMNMKKEMKMEHKVISLKAMRENSTILLKSKVFWLVKSGLQVSL